MLDSKNISMLHQLLPVESALQGTLKKVFEEAIQTFQKRDRFSGFSKQLLMNDEDRKSEEITERQAITTSVNEKLEYLSEHIVRYYDAFLQKEKTNQIAVADIVLDDGSIFMEKVPATALLGLLDKLKELRKVYDAIPTLSPGVSWVKTDDPNVYKTEHDDIKNKTEKSIQCKVLVPATDKHPAQIEKWPFDMVVGKYVTKLETSVLSPIEKSRLLAKIDKLIQAVTSAKMKANTAEVQFDHIGQKIVDYIKS